MIANDSLTPEAQQRQLDRKRKRKAILAGGVVLGLGAAVTLAAWSDDVFANGTFNTGSFDLIGSADTTAATGELAYADWDGISPADTPNGANLTFELEALEMSPGETVAAPFSIAQKTGTNIDGRVWMYEANASGDLAPYLEYDIKVIDAPTDCVADDPVTTADETADLALLPTWNAGEFSALVNTVENHDGQRGATPTVPTQDLLVEQNFGDQQHLCIQVTLADEEDDIADIVSTTNSSIVWQFKGESETPSS